MIAPASRRILPVEEPLDCILETRIFREAKLTQNGDILEEVGGIAQRETQLKPESARRSIAPACRVRGGGRVAGQEERDSLLDGAFHMWSSL